MDAAPLLEYFEPITRLLQEQNKDECFGWGQKWPDAIMKTLPANRCSMFLV